MERQYMIAIVWFFGFMLSLWMLRAEHEAEKEEYTNGDRVLSVLLSLLSFAMILFILVKAWAVSLGVKGYWKKPVKAKKPE